MPTLITIAPTNGGVVNLHFAEPLQYAAQTHHHAAPEPAPASDPAIEPAIEPGWYIVHKLGHVTLAGWLDTVRVGDATLLRVRCPAVDGGLEGDDEDGPAMMLPLPERTDLFHPAALYGLESSTASEVYDRRRARRARDWAWKAPSESSEPAPDPDDDTPF